MPPVLTQSQEAAIAHPAQRLQILACAGSGKTEVLARRAVRLLLSGVDPASLIAFTFTDKAATELKARIEARAAEADPRFRDLPPAGRGMFIGTTHSWALQALQELGGNYETMEGLTSEQEWVLLHRMARRLGIIDLYARHEGKPAERIAAARAIEGFLRSAEVVHNERIDRETLRERSPVFVEVLERYEWLLDRMRLLPFRLMIGRAIDELAPGGRLRRRLEGRITQVLVDEFQDFNRAQDLMLQGLHDLGANVTVVGDDDQAIYQWRGGDVSLFRTFVERRQAERVDLDLNHRCRPEILAFARHVVEHLGGRLDKVLGSAREPAHPGSVEVAVAPDAVGEAEHIARRIEELLADGHRPSDVAVLYRSVRTSARPLIDELRSRGIPVAVVGKTSLLARPEMALIARLFVLWAGGTWYPNPEFEPEVVTRSSLIEEVRGVTGASGRDAERMMARLDRVHERILAEGVADSVALYDEILAILALPGKDHAARWRELGLGRMSELLTDFDHAVRRAAPSELYASTPAGTADEPEEDATLAADRAGRSKPHVLGASRGQIYLYRLREFLAAFAGRAAEETPDSAPEAHDAVQIMTVHQAKGLEFPIVFVPSLIEGRFPSSMMGRPQLWYVPEDLFDRTRYEGREDDEARLLYVALTRARELLVVSWFESHAKKRARASRFVTNHLKPALAGAMALGNGRPLRQVAFVKEELLDVDFSSLVTYFQCGYRYWLRHVCGFQPPMAPELGFGKILHHVVAEMARMAMAGHPPEPQDVEAILDRDFYLPFAGPIPAGKLREVARRRSLMYLRDHGGELSRVIRPEARFEVPLANARVRGRIDLMLRAGNGDGRRVELVDFKTSSNRPPSQIHQNQLRMYAVAAERMGLEPVRLFIHDLDDDSPDGKNARIPVPNDEAQRDAFAGTLEGWVEGIRGDRFEPTTDAAQCRTCDFRRFCRYAPAEVRTR